MRRRFVKAFLASAAGFCLIVPAGIAAQNLPAGTRSADDARHPGAQNDAYAAEVRSAEDALERRDYAAAEQILGSLTKSRPNDPQLLYDLGFAQEGGGKEEDAARSYAAAIAADPRLAEPRIALGLLQARTGHAAEARDVLLEASKLDAAPALRGRALRALTTLDEAARPEQARQELLAAIQLTGETSADLKTTADLAAGAEDWADAEVAYRKVLAADPDDVLATSGLGRALQHEGRLADADTLLSGEVARHADSAPLVAQLASVQMAEGKTKDAIAAVEQLRKLSPQAANDPAANRLLARLYAADGNYEAAAALFTRLLGATPDDPELLDALGSVQVKEGQYAPAETNLAKAVGLRQSFGRAEDWGEAEGHLAFAASKNNHPQVTLQALAARATVLPNSPASLFLEATAHDTLHQYREAEKAYHAFLTAANGKFPDEEFQARHRLIALEHAK